MTAKEQLRSLFILLRKEVLRFFRIWSQTLIPSVLTTILYFLIFGTFIGERIGKMSGFDYMQFMAPGLVMLAVITNAIQMWFLLSSESNFKGALKSC